MRRTLVVSGFSILLAACGDDGGGADTGAMTEASTMDPTAATDPTGTSTPTSTTMDPTGASETMVDPTGAACDSTDQATIDMCVMGAMAMPDYCPEVGDCNCGSCACELAACEADVGCTAIRECAQEMGCLGIECLDEMECGAVIEMHGGVGGTSGMIGLMLSTCVEASGCPTQCPGAEGSGSGGSGSGTAG